MYTLKKVVTLLKMFIDYVAQLTVMFPDMTKVSLERTLQAWNNDMQRTVTAILGAQEGNCYCF